MQSNEYEPKGIKLKIKTNNIKNNFSTRSSINQIESQQRNDRLQHQSSYHQSYDSIMEQQDHKDIAGLNTNMSTILQEKGSHMTI